METPVVHLRLSLYPNPTSDYLNVFYFNPKHSGVVHFRIVDVQGRTMQAFSSTMNNITHIVSMEGYASGQYFLNVQFEGQMISESFLVE